MIEVDTLIRVTQKCGNFSSEWCNFVLVFINQTFTICWRLSDAICKYLGAAGLWSSKGGSGSGEAERGKTISGGNNFFLWRHIYWVTVVLGEMKTYISGNVWACCPCPAQASSHHLHKWGTGWLCQGKQNSDVEYIYISYMSHIYAFRNMKINMLTFTNGAQADFVKARRILLKPTTHC